MSLSDNYLKEVLSQAYNVKADDIVEKSKAKDEKNQIIRVFEIDELDVVVVSDPGDNALIEFFLADEEMVEIVTDVFDKYIFAVSKLNIGHGLIAIVNKKLWQFGALEVMPQEEFDMLPEYISDIEGSIISQLQCTIDTRYEDIITDLTNIGFTYSNDLALFLNKTEGQKLFELKF